MGLFLEVLVVLPSIRPSATWLAAALLNQVKVNHDCDLRKLCLLLFSGFRRRHRALEARERHGRNHREDSLPPGAAGNPAARVEVGLGPQGPLPGFLFFFWRCCYEAPFSNLKLRCVHRLRICQRRAYFSPKARRGVSGSRGEGTASRELRRAAGLCPRCRPIFL